MNCQLQHWINETADDSYYSQHFCSKIGTLYLGVKPCEILNVSFYHLRRAMILNNRLKVEILSSDIKNDRYKVVIYNEEALIRTLNKNIVLKNLKRIGYSSNFNLDSYMQTLILRIKEQDSFPHEIGFFLGYPAKDVLGYMGLIDIPYTKTVGWKIYGSETASIDYYNNIQNTKNDILSYLKQNIG